LFLIPGRWIESENPISLKVIHHRQNPIVTRSTKVSKKQVLKGKVERIAKIKINNIIFTLKAD
jgi:hypothetical protein